MVLRELYGSVRMYLFLRHTPSIENEVLISDKCSVVVQASKVIKSSSV